MDPCDACNSYFDPEELHPSGDRVLCADCLLDEPRAEIQPPGDARAAAMRWLKVLSVFHGGVAVLLGVGQSPLAPGWMLSAVLFWGLRSGRLAMGTRYRLAAAVVAAHATFDLAVVGAYGLIVLFSPYRMIALALLFAGWRKARDAGLPRATVRRDAST